jgi:outer membrane protein assembly factor BamB
VAPAQQTLEGAAKPLRVWPGIVAVTIQWLSRFGLKAVVPGFSGFASGMLGSFAAAAGVVIWWVFFSRAAWVDRVAGLLLTAAAIAVTWRLNHESMGLFWLLAYGIHVWCLAFVLWAVACRRLPADQRRVALVATILVTSGFWAVLRTEGVTGDHALVFHWRWADSPEEQLLASRALDPRPTAPAFSTPHAPAPAATDALAARTSSDVLVPPAVVPEDPIPVATRAEWPGFRGQARDGIARGAWIETDWSKAPPIELWRRSVGPGWSSFAVSGDLIYTQEQRGDEEVVAAYKATTGEPVWMHRDRTRFYEPMAGAGPRGTPTVSSGRVYTFGGTGIVNALDAASGTVVWTRNGAADAGARVPDWGFSSSPLLVDDVVIVAVSGRLVAYDRASGTPRWQRLSGGGSYSSPQLFTIDGIAQVVLMSEAGTVSVSPGDGAKLWEYSWPGSFPIVQPALIAGSDVLLAGGANSGVRRVGVARGPGGWKAEDRWESNGLKPYFNDFAIHNGHAYGFDGRILACIDLADGARRWKGGRYGNGQLMLLPDQDLLLVLSDEGELALVRAASDGFTELARVPALTGKTWNHPVLVGDMLVVRNGEEMAAFRLQRSNR